MVRISSLDQDLVVRAINNLEYLGAEISIEKAKALLTQNLTKTSLKKSVSGSEDRSELTKILLQKQER